MTTPYKEWLNNEYQQWGAALSQSTVYNFKEHPQVKRMLGEIEWPEEFCPTITSEQYKMISEIDNIGRLLKPIYISDTCWRMVYYAKQVLNYKPPSIVEIGGGVGEFYAILRALGYTSQYFIMDFVEVQMFQEKYLHEVEHQTGLKLPQHLYFDFCISFYALGEFDDELKQFYVERVVNHCPHGFVLWNPHSGATKDIPFKFDYTVKDEYPMLHPDCKQVEW